MIQLFQRLHTRNLSKMSKTAATSTPKPIQKSRPNSELATFAAGCFWSVELAFQRIEGVLQTQVGYTGGSVQDPSYTDVW